MRPVWKGAISFGLVNIPIRLYIVASPQRPRFRMLHNHCHGPIQFRRWCPRCETEVEAEEIDRGYEVSPDRFVVLTDDDLDALPLPTAHTIQILDFVELSSVDPVYFEKSYYIEPSEGAGRPYALLRRAMEETGRAALAKVLLRSRESLAAVRTFGKDQLVLHTMYYSADLREPVGLEGPATVEVDPRELQMATSLVTNLTVDFDIQRYHSDYREALARLVEQKVEGQEGVAAEPDRPRVIELMEALRESVRLSEQTRRARAGP